MSLDLHTNFAIFLYSFQLETAMLTGLVLTDAADAERSVFASLVMFISRTILTIIQSVKTSRTTSSKITIREGGRACRSTNEIQLRMGEPSSIPNSQKIMTDIGLNKIQRS
jgi:hypothetical protein